MFNGVRRGSNATQPKELEEQKAVAYFNVMFLRQAGKAEKGHDV
jgi:hypothetical protein